MLIQTAMNTEQTLDAISGTHPQDEIVTSSAQEAFDNLTETVGQPQVEKPKMRTENVDVFYGDKQAIYDVSLDIGNNEVIAMIGPSGCGKSPLCQVHL